MSNKIEELKKDIAELKCLEEQATRQKNKDILSIEIRKLISELTRLEDLTKSDTGASLTLPESKSVSYADKQYEIKLSNYAWDQTNKFVKFYVTLQNVQSIPSENIICSFTHNSLELSVKKLDNKNYSFRISHLLEPIDPEQSTWKVKADMIIISAAKKQQTNWSHVTEWEKKSSDAQKLKEMDTDKVEDPTEGLMSLMKKMYEKGDDQMKRTIAKAWTESQMKNPTF